jgi:hypothetical protein
LNSVTAQPIAGTAAEAVSTPAWSPDGRSIAYISDSKLHTLDLSGGSPQTIASGAIVPRPTWTPAGTLLFHNTATEHTLMQVSAAGGNAMQVVNSGIYYASPLPGGQSYVYTKPNSVDLFSGTLDSKDEKRLTTGSLGVFVQPHWLLYVRASALVVQEFDPVSQSLSGGTISIAQPVGVSSQNLGFFSVS